MKGLHLIVVCVTLAIVLYADEQAFLWMLGRRETLKKRLLEVLHAGTGVGLALTILTGGLILIDRPGFLSEPAFIVKMVLVLALVVNSFFIGTLSHIAATRPYRSVTQGERRKLFVAGGISVLCWAGALVCGLLL